MTDTLQRYSARDVAAMLGVGYEWAVALCRRCGIPKWYGRYAASAAEVERMRRWMAEHRPGNPELSRPAAERNRSRVPR